MHADKQIKISLSLSAIQGKEILKEAKEAVKYFFLAILPS